MEGVAFMRGFRVTAVLVAAVACSSPAMPPSGPGLGQPELARWFVDVNPAPPVAGYRAHLYLEFVSPPDAPVSRHALEGQLAVRSRIPLTARCLTCAAPSVEGVAIQEEIQGPDSVAHVGATALFFATVMFPTPGSWRVEPFGTVIEVRGLSPFEPPVIDIRTYSDPLPDGCGRAEISDLVKGFERAYNTGNAELLASVVQDGVDFSIAGGESPLILQGRDPFVAGIVARHARGERIEFTALHLASDRGVVGMAIDAIRTAPDLRQGRQLLTGKARAYCSPQQFIHLNLGTIP
jgi:hypothetical protein